MPSFLLRDMRLVPRISRAQESWLRHDSRTAWKHGEAAKSWCANANGSGEGQWHENIKAYGLGIETPWLATSHQAQVVSVTHKRSASLLTIFAHVFGVLAFILMLVWLLHYRGGIEYVSYNGSRVFNVHLFLMFYGFILLSGEAMMVYKTVPAAHSVQKIVHIMFQLGAFVLGLIGLCAAFKYYDMANIEDVFTLHSWIGIVPVSLFALQWLAGLVTYMFPQSEVRKQSLLPWHVCGGRTLLYMSIAAALTGLQEKATFLGLGQNVIFQNIFS